ncbi:hypothetical protein KAX08_08605 [candidate division WOR-3 bacterium]|nr:hypothetical protein [candidate division WOR-3 bacterium]
MFIPVNEELFNWGQTPGTLFVFRPVDEVILEFEKKKGIKIIEIKTNKFAGEKLRAELLVLLRDEAGLTYKEIIEYPIFKSLKYESLGHLYQKAKDRIAESYE